MKKCFFLCALFLLITSSSLFSAIYWTGGGAAGVWEDQDNWDKTRIPEEGDDVVIDGPFTVTLSSTLTIESLRLGNGASLTIEASYTLTVFDNNNDGVKLEKTSAILIIDGTLNSYGHKDHGVELDSMNTILIVNGTLNAFDNGDHGVYLNDIGPEATINGTLNAFDNDKFGVLIDGYDITVTLNGTLNSHNNGDAGVAMDGSSSGAVTLIVNGTLNSYENAMRGMEVERYAFLIIPASGEIYLSDNAGDGIILEEDVTNEGIISILNSGKIGLNTGGNPNKDLINNGTITISGAVTGIDGKDTNWDITNYGTISITNADTLVDLGTDIFTFGDFIGNGLVENGNNFDMTFHPGSTIEPGPSIAKLTFTDLVDFSGVNLEIEIAGASSYDQIVVDTGYHGPADVTLTGAVLNLSGNYTPTPGDKFMIFEKVAPGPIEGNFDGLPEGSILIYKGEELMISYTGGDGNDITLTYLGALPVELIDFNARPLANEVQLSWTTATELNNNFFTIERSADGRNFEAIANIDGMGSTTEISKYYHTDKNPLNGLNYYRLKQTDFDGEFSYSDIKTVEFKNDETVKVYPTLVEDMVTLETNGSLNGEITVIVRDLSGKDCKSFEIAEKSEKIELPLNDLNPGSYFIVIYDDNGLHTQKIIKL